tara:strand:+ start:294 stop:479 length:186 start_codon:yes stop_codon:yes gene_type:complete
MMSSSSDILPGSSVIVKNITSIYNGYTGFVQRISGDKAAVLFEGGNWDKLITLNIKDLESC